MFYVLFQVIFNQVTYFYCATAFPSPENQWQDTRLILERNIDELVLRYSSKEKSSKKLIQQLDDAALFFVANAFDEFMNTLTEDPSALTDSKLG